jgi:hypothetical protein
MGPSLGDQAEHEGFDHVVETVEGVMTGAGKARVWLTSD